MKHYRDKDQLSFEFSDKPMEASDKDEAVELNINIISAAETESALIKETEVPKKIDVNDFERIRESKIKEKKRLEGLRKRKKSRLRREKERAEFDSLDLLQFIFERFDGFISPDTVDEVKVLLEKIPYIILNEEDEIDDEILYENPSVENFEKLAEYLNSEQRESLYEFIEQLLEVYYEDSDIEDEEE